MIIGPRPEGRPDIHDHEQSRLRRGVFFAALGGHDCSAGPQAPAQGIVMAVVPVVGSRAGARPKAGGLHG